MLGTARVARGFPGRLHVGKLGISRTTGHRRAPKRSLRSGPPSVPPPTSEAAPVLLASAPSQHQRKARASFSTTRRAEEAIVEGRKVPGTDDIIRTRFLRCLERQDVKGAMAHFAFIAIEGGRLVTLRRRQLLVLLCEKGLIKEASELLTYATASPTFDSQDSSTIASFMYVMCGCLRYGDVDRALEHFRHASARGIALDLPLCESLATALFIKGLQGDSTEKDAWHVLDFIRKRGMKHRPQVCDHALLYAMAVEDLSFALRMCQYVHDEGISCDSDVRVALCRLVAQAIRKLPETAAVTDGEEGAGWKVEGTNATLEELETLEKLLHQWLDAEMDDVHEDFLVDDDGDGEDVVFDADTGLEVAIEGHEDFDVRKLADVVDYENGDILIAAERGAEDFDNALPLSEGGNRRGTGDQTAQDAADFAGDEFRGDLIDQMSVSYPNEKPLVLIQERDDRDGLSGGSRRPGADGSDPSRLAVYNDSMMTPQTDARSDDMDGLDSLIFSVRTQDHSDDDDDDDDDEDGDAV